MDKERLLQELSTKLGTGEISSTEVLQRLNLTQHTRGDAAAGKSRFSHVSVTKMLYVLGAVIVIAGIVIFVAQVWDDIGAVGRVGVTLGLGLLIAVTGSVLMKQKPHDYIGPVFHFIAGVLIPGGALVTLHELGVDVGVSPWLLAFTFVALFAFYVFLNIAHKHPLLTFFTIANGTVALYLILNALIGSPSDGIFDIKNAYQYLTMAIGISYLLLARAFVGGWNRRLVGMLYFFGSAGFFVATFFFVFDSIPWQILYFLLVLGGLLLSVYMRSRSILTVSTLFLIAHISYVTGEHFADTLGWPISLVILGFVFIGLGYTSITINKKYIKNTDKHSV